MIVLALETSTDYCSIALEQAGKVAVRNTDGTQQGSRFILPLINELLEQEGVLPSSLQQLVWSHGPGSFTGLRIGASVMQGMAFALQLPVAGFSSLQALAQTIAHDMQLSVGTRILVAVDARMGDWYIGDYCVQDTTVHQVSLDRLLPAAEWMSLCAVADNAPVVLAGAVWHIEHLNAFAKGTTIAITSTPMASALLRLAGNHYELYSTADVQPVYLRGANIWKKTAEQAVEINP